MIGPVMLQGINQVMPETSTIKAHEDVKPMIDQAGMVQQGHKDADAKQEMVVKRENASLGEQKHDAKEKGKNEYVNLRKTKSSDEKKDGDVTLKTPNKGGFDMKI